MTRWLVDGMNVIGSRPDGWWRDRRGAMRRLVEDLARLEGDVTVVLDGDDPRAILAAQGRPKTAVADTGRMLNVTISQINEKLKG